MDKAKKLFLSKSIQICATKCEMKEIKKENFTDEKKECLNKCFDNIRMNLEKNIELRSNNK